MKLSAAIASGGLRKRLERLLAELEPAALDAASDALAVELAKAREGENLPAPFLRGPMRAAVSRAVARALSRRR